MIAILCTYYVLDYINNYIHHLNNPVIVIISSFVYGFIRSHYNVNKDHVSTMSTLKLDLSIFYGMGFTVGFTLLAHIIPKNYWCFLCILCIQNTIIELYYKRKN